MKILISISLLILNMTVFAQLDSLEINTLYVGDYVIASRIVDSTNILNDYPRQGTINYMLEIYDSFVGKYGIIMNKVTEKYIAKIILDAYGFPAMRIPLDVITTPIEAKIWTEATINGWNLYKKNGNLFMWNFNRLADNEFTAGQIDWINENGQTWNFE